MEGTSGQQRSQGLTVALYLFGPSATAQSVSHSANGVTKHVVTGRVIGPGVGLGEGPTKGAGRFRSIDR